MKDLFTVIEQSSWGMTQKDRYGKMGIFGFIN